MAKILAIEWDAHEARVAIARRRGRELTLEHAFTVELQPRDPGTTFADTNVGERVGAALTARGIGRSDAVVAVGRASIELRVLTLPPAPEAELPDMVRFQAMRQFSTLGDDWPLDFTTLQTSDDESLSVLAAAISPDLVKQIGATCLAGQLAARRMALRPFSAASLLQRQLPSASCRLMVDVLSDEADLTVLADDRVVFLRTVPLPRGFSAESKEMGMDLVREIRRTMVAAQNQLGGRPLEKVVICGHAGEQAGLQTLIREQLDLPVQSFDPFAGIELTPELKARMPDAPGRFTPLIGLLLDESHGKPPAIDFLNPRRKTEGREKLRRNLLVGAVVVIALLAIGMVVRSSLQSLNAKVAELQKQSAALNPLVVAAGKKVKEAEQIDKFTESDVTWLDELYEISRKFPAGEKVFANQAIFNAAAGEGGQILLKGFTDEYSTIEAIERSLRDKRHQVFGKGGTEDTDRKTYPWVFEEVIVVQKPSAPPVKQPAPSPAPEKRPGSAPAQGVEQPPERKNPAAAFDAALEPTSRNAAAPQGEAR